MIVEFILVVHYQHLAVKKMTPNAVGRVGSSVCRVRSGKLAELVNKSLSTSSQLNTCAQRNPDKIQPESKRRLMTKEEQCIPVKNQVIFQEYGECGLITLNQPKKMNVLNTPISLSIIAKIREWEKRKGFVMIEGSGDQAFCAGGDLNMVAFTVKEDINPLAIIYFAALFRLCYVVNQCRIPYIALMDKLTMGGGTAVSVAGTYRVVTEKTVYGMPEVLIGHFPDAGCSYFYTRFPNYIGYYLAMTATTLNGIDLLRLGIGTHYVPSERLADLKDDLLASKAQDVEVILHKYQPKDLFSKESNLAPYIKNITECFSAPTVDEIVSRLEKDKSKWAKKTIEKIDQACPFSVKLAHCMLQKGENMNLAECLKMEYRVAVETVKPNENIAEGVQTKVVDRTFEPQWNPKYLKDVTEEQILRVFNQREELQLDLSA